MPILAAREVKAKVKNKEEKRRVMVMVDMRLTLGMMTCRRERSRRCRRKVQTFCLLTGQVLPN